LHLLSPRTSPRERRAPVRRKLTGRLEQPVLRGVHRGGMRAKTTSGRSNLSENEPATQPGASIPTGAVSATPIPSYVRLAAPANASSLPESSTMPEILASILPDKNTHRSQRMSLALLPPAAMSYPLAAVGGVATGAAGASTLNPAALDYSKRVSVPESAAPPQLTTEDLPPASFFHAPPVADLDKQELEKPGLDALRESSLTGASDASWDGDEMDLSKFGGQTDMQMTYGSDPPVPSIADNNLDPSVRIHTKYLDVETLNFYRIGWKLDAASPYLLIQVSPSTN
jgi:hypothetical protein